MSDVPKSTKRGPFLNQEKFSFGVTSAIMTNLGLIVGLETLSHPKLSMVSAILVIALADNIADSFGIHIYQESECKGVREVWLSTLTNFLARFLVSASFILLVLALPVHIAVVCSIAWGLLLLAVMSYFIAKRRDVHPYYAVIEHITIASFIIIASRIVSKFIVRMF
jgi:VIT1/CCC1 family predicted Fe2+/Mn2+ transporter